MLINIIAGGALCAAGLSFMTRAYLLSGGVKAWPTSPKWLRVVLFCVGAALAAQGVATARWAPETAPETAMGVVVIAVLVAIGEVALLFNLAAQRACRTERTNDQSQILF